MQQSWLTFKNKVKEPLQNKYLQELACALAEIILKAAVVTLGSLYKNRITPYAFACISIVLQMFVVGLAVRSTLWSWKNSKTQNKLLKKFESQYESTEELSEPQREVIHPNFIIAAMVLSQFAYVSLTVITPLLYSYGIIRLREAVIIGVTAFILGVLPQALSSANSVYYARVNVERMEIVYGKKETDLTCCKCSYMLSSDELQL